MQGLTAKLFRRTTLVLCAVLCVSVSMSATALAQNAVNERIGIAGPIPFGGVPFKLAWTSHPSPQYYKQEYLPAGQSVDRYNSMLMIDLIVSGTTVAQSARTMIQNLQVRKATDPVVNYDVITNHATGDMILDFVMSATGADGKEILEWNAYRYSKQGSGVRMVGISRRVYGDDVAPFLQNQLGAVRKRDIDALSKLVLPAIRVAAP
jgi:hypothetical protein